MKSDLDRELHRFLDMAYEWWDQCDELGPDQARREGIMLAPSAGCDRTVRLK